MEGWRVDSPENRKSPARPECSIRVSLSDSATMYLLRRFAVEIGESLKPAAFAGTNRIPWISMMYSRRALGIIGLKAGAIASNGESDAEEQH
jgi:hypothetical protein